MHPRALPFLLVSFIGIVLLAVACSGTAAAAGECLEPRDGEMVAVPCVVPGEPDSTATELPASTTLPEDVVTPAPSTGGLGVFVREGTCFTCHTIESVPQARGQIGPDLSHIGQKGEAYIRQSILEPNAVIAEKCPAGPCAAGLMPAIFEQILTGEQIDAVVAYLLSLK